jgi:hypothetical protein
MNCTLPVFGDTKHTERKRRGHKPKGFKNILKMSKWLYMVKQDSRFWSSVGLLPLLCHLALAPLLFFSPAATLLPIPSHSPVLSFPCAHCLSSRLLNPLVLYARREVSGIGGTKVGVELPFLASLQVQETATT